MQYNRIRHRMKLILVGFVVICSMFFFSLGFWLLAFAPRSPHFRIFDQCLIMSLKTQIMQCIDMKSTCRLKTYQTLLFFFFHNFFLLSGHVDSFDLVAISGAYSSHVCEVSELMSKGIKSMETQARFVSSFSTSQICLHFNEKFSHKIG